MEGFFFPQKGKAPENDTKIRGLGKNIKSNKLLTNHKVR